MLISQTEKLLEALFDLWARAVKQYGINKINK